MIDKLREYWVRGNLWLDRRLYPGFDVTYEEWVEHGEPGFRELEQSINELRKSLEELEEMNRA